MQQEETGFLLKRVNDEVSKWLNEQLRASTLSMSEYRVLKYLKENQDRNCAQKNIEAYFGLSHPTVVTMIRHLSEEGIICIAQNEKDKRIKNLTLSEKGEKMLDEAFEECTMLEEKIAQALTNAENVKLKTILGKLLASF